MRVGRAQRARANKDSGNLQHAVSTSRYDTATPRSTSGMTRAAIYTRISRDLTGERAGVARQEEDCRAKASALGWEVMEVFVDNDISAYSGRARPGYQALLKAARTGKWTRWSSGTLTGCTAASLS
jgi:resolvase-like protein